MNPHDQKAAGLEVEFSIEVLAEGGATLELCRQYWQLDATGGFVHTVANIGKPFSLPPSTVTAYAEKYSRAFFPDVRCTSCGNPHLIKNRADYASSKSLRQVPRSCRECREAQRLEAQRAAEEQRRLRVAAIQEELATRRREFWWIPPRMLSFDDAVFLLSIFRSGGSDDLTYVLPHSAFAVSLSPTTQFDRRILDHLYQRRILAIHPGSTPESVVGEGGAFTSFFPFKVHWVLPIPEDGPSPARYLEDLEELLKSEHWPDEWTEDARELHRAVAFEECLEYLRVSLEDHGFDSNPGEKLSLVLRSILRHFSIGQTYNFIWRAATNAAAFYVRERTSRAHARNIVPGSLQRMAERALAERWTVKAYRRDRRIPESQLSHVLFTMALRLPDGGLNAVPPSPPPDEPESVDSSDDGTE